MTREEIAEFFARRQDALVRLDAAALTALHAEDGVLESPLAGTISGRHPIEQFYRGLFTSFPDFTYEPEDILIDGDRVAQLATFGGTNTGGFMDLAPTGRHIRIAGVFLFTFSDRQISRMRSMYDFTLMLVQIGILKVKPL
jgi:steroid delta-isomerase-like uncharacterized protein